MDITCPRCGEPWEIDYVNHELTREERRDMLTGLGCSSACRRDVARDDRRTTVAFAVLEVCGDDLDGAAALMEDLAL